MLAQFYRRYIARKYVNKIVLLFILITTVAFVIMSYVITINVEKLIRDKEIKYNHVVLGQIREQLDDDYGIVRTILSRALIDKKYLLDIYFFLENNMDGFNLDYIATKPIFDNYILSAISRSRDIMGISVYKQADSRVYLYTELHSEYFSSGEYPYRDSIHKMEQARETFGIFPTLTKTDYLNEKKQSFTIATNIKSDNLIDNLGTILVDFDPNQFQRTISLLANGLKSQLLILTRSGEVIFDSTERFYGQRYPYLTEVMNADGAATIYGQKSMVYRTQSANNGNVVISIVPEKLIFSQLSRLKKSILLISMLCIIGCIVLMIIGSAHFSRRVRTITHTIKKIGTSDLHVLIPVNPQLQDEIGEIAHHINRMGARLQDYVERYFALELRQKNSELKALQAQINPHFLYNTLESIRMKAVRNDDHEVGEMIYLLAKLFRSSVKDDMVIPLREELGYLQMYLSLFDFRYRSIFDFEMDIDDSLLNLGVIKHFLQPLLENYFVHGFDRKSDGNRLVLRGKMDGKLLRFTLLDNGRGISQERLDAIRVSLDGFQSGPDSIGLINVHERIGMVYGQEYGISIESAQHVGTEVTVLFPIKTVEEVRQNVQSNTRG